MPVNPSLKSLSLAALREELERRRSKLPRLERQAKRLTKTLAALNAEIAALGGTTPAAPSMPGKPGRKRGAKPGRKPGRPPGSGANAKPGRKRGPRPGTSTLGGALATIMSPTDAMSVAQARDALLAAGYKNPPKTFTTMLYQVLGRDPRFKRAGRGKYLLKS